ncbi:MAG: ribonuclease Z [Clostridia bacterium]|nr:ribonuclease Z [Clostridia bacterium]
MKITFVGSSHGVPEPHRKCTCIMLEVGENVYFVDMGTSAIDALITRGISVDAVKGVFVTHMHGDHTHGLIQFVDLITWYFRTPDPVICLPVPDAAKVIDAWLDVTLNIAKKEIRYRETQPGVVFDDGILKVTAIATQHCLKSYAYLVEAEGKTVLFTGDLKNPGIDFPDISGKTVDLVVCETAHFPSTDYLPVFEKYDIKKVCVTHYSDRFLASVLSLCETLNEKGIPALRSTDDLELNV